MKFFNIEWIRNSRRLVLAVVILASAVAIGAKFNSVFNFNSNGGSLAAYLIGAVDGKDHTNDDCWGKACPDTGDVEATSDTNEAVVRLVNPTDFTLTALIAAYTRNNPLFFIGCTTRTLLPNAYAEVRLIDTFRVPDTHDFTVKVLTLDSANPTRVQAGVKGWLTHYFAETIDTGTTLRLLHMRETELQQVAIHVANAGESAKIIADCPSIIE